MAEMNDRCLLGKEGTSNHCKGACGTCGWNPKVEKARSAQIEANGLTLCSDGLQRLIIRKGGADNGNI